MQHKNAFPVGCVPPTCRPYTNRCQYPLEGWVPTHLTYPPCGPTPEYLPSSRAYPFPRRELVSSLGSDMGPEIPPPLPEMKWYQEYLHPSVDRQTSLKTLPNFRYVWTKLWWSRICLPRWAVTFFLRRARWLKNPTTTVPFGKPPHSTS